MRPQAPGADIAKLSPVKQEIPMIDEERCRDRPDIKGKIKKNSSESTQLNDRYRCSRLLGIPAVQVSPSAGKNKMCRRTDWNELGETLDYT